MSEQPHEEPRLVDTLEKIHGAFLSFSMLNALFTEADFLDMFRKASVFPEEERGVDEFFEKQHEQLSQLFYYSFRSFLIQKEVYPVNFSPSEKQRFLRELQEGVKNMRDTLNPVIDQITSVLLEICRPEVKQSVNKHYDDIVDETYFDTLKRVTEKDVMSMFAVPRYAEVVDYYNVVIDNIFNRREKDVTMGVFDNEESFLAVLEEGCHSYIDGFKKMVKQDPNVRISNRAAEEKTLSVIAGMYMLEVVVQEKELLNSYFVELAKHGRNRGESFNER